MPPGADYVVWLQTSTALTAAGNRLWLWRANDPSGKWQLIADVTQYGLRHVSRLALSPNHEWLAIVAESTTALSP
jgi:hypothetical protein